MLFTLELPDTRAFEQPTEQPLWNPTPEQLERIRVAQTLEEAAAARDRAVEELRKHADFYWTVQYETEYGHIQDQYEQVVRSVLPGLYPTVQVAPGLRTSGWDTIDEAARQAIAQGAAASADADRSGLARQLSTALGRPLDGLRLAVTGPVACSAGANRPVR
jgi:hypothetical protein